MKNDYYSSFGFSYDVFPSSYTGQINADSSLIDWRSAPTVPPTSCQVWHDQTDTGRFIITASDRLTLCQLLPSPHSSQPPRCSLPVYLTPEHLSPPADRPLPRSSIITDREGTALHYAAGNKLAKNILELLHPSDTSVLVLSPAPVTTHHTRTSSLKIEILHLLCIQTGLIHLSKSSLSRNISTIYWGFIINTLHLMCRLG